MPWGVHLSEVPTDVNHPFHHSRIPTKVWCTIPNTLDGVCYLSFSSRLLVNRMIVVLRASNTSSLTLCGKRH